MKKRFLGIICLLYSIIIIYVWLSNTLKNFLAPTMQIYLKVSLIPLILMGLILCFNNKIHYKFKISDLVLILPIIMLIFAGDGKLTLKFANNRTSKVTTESNNKKEDIEKEKVEESTDEEVEKEISNDEIEEEKVLPEYDFSNVDFDVADPTYEGLASYITYTTNFDYYNGKTIRVRGFTLKKSRFLPDNYFMIGKYSISCCAADASYVGFIVNYDKYKEIKDNAWYEIEGVLEVGKDREKINVMVIKVINIKEIDSKDEETYVYPCYSYDNGNCTEMKKYDLQL